MCDRCAGTTCKMSKDCKRKAETGLQLLARLSSRPSVVGLEDVLFKEGPNHKDIIEVSGESGVGKTLLLTQFLAKCLLPVEWNGIPLGGQGAGVIFINTDHHFKIFKLISLMGDKLRTFQKPKHGDKSMNASDIEDKSSLKANEIEDIIKDSLKNLILLNCFDSVQLFVTFCSLEKLLLANTNVSLLLIDSLSAYYWQDVMVGGYRRMNSYEANLLQTLNRYVHEYKIVMIYTKQTYFQSKFRDGGYNADTSVSGIKYKVKLKQAEIENNKLFCANVQMLNSETHHFYKISKKGIHWVNCN